MAEEREGYRLRAVLVGGQLLGRRGEHLQIAVAPWPTTGDHADMLDAQIFQRATTVDELVDRLFTLQRRAEVALDVLIGPPDIGAVSLQHLELVADGLSAIGDVEKAAGIAGFGHEPQCAA